MFPLCNFWSTIWVQQGRKTAKKLYYALESRILWPPILWSRVSEHCLYFCHSTIYIFTIPHFSVLIISFVNPQLLLSRILRYPWFLIPHICYPSFLIQHLCHLVITAIVHDLESTLFWIPHFQQSRIPVILYFCDLQSQLSRIILQPLQG